MPLVLRAVDFLGINVSRAFPMSERLRIWARLGGDLKPRNLEKIIREVSLQNLPSTFRQLISSDSIGRIVVRVNNDIT